MGVGETPLSSNGNAQSQEKPGRSERATSLMRGTQEREAEGAPFFTRRLQSGLAPALIPLSLLRKASSVSLQLRGPCPLTVVSQ